MKQWLGVIVAVSVTVPGLALAATGRWGISPVLAACLFGGTVVGAAFLLSWGSQVIQKDISQALAMVLLALIAVLPEYSVDLYFAWAAAQKPEYAAYALANMTGGNRLLVGFAWPLVVGVFWLRMRKTTLILDPDHRLELAFLILATVYSFSIPFRGALTLWDGLLLIGLFGWYAWRAARAHVQEPDLVGPARAIGVLPSGARRAVTATLFLFSAVTIIRVAEPFAESLVSAGKGLGIDEFLVVQWLAPLASEAPEMVVAILLVLNGQGPLALGTLISSKVNQWTLLVGSLPIAYGVSGGRVQALPIDVRQGQELFLTAAQSAFGLALLLNLRLSLWEAGGLFSLFAVQLLVPETRVAVSITYIGLSIVLLWRHRAFVTPTLAAIVNPRPKPREVGPVSIGKSTGTGDT